MRNVLHGRHVGVEPVARRPSRLVSLAWVAAQLRALVQLVQLLRAFGDGPSPHALAKHGSPASPRPAAPDATHPPSIAGGAAELALTCGRAAGHASGFGQGALGTGARPWGARVRPGTEPHPCVSPRRRVADLQACTHPTLTLTLTLTDTFRAVITGHGRTALGPTVG